MQGSLLHVLESLTGTIFRKRVFFKIVLKNYFFLHTNPTYVPFRVNVFQHARGIKLRELNDENELT